MFYFQKVNKNLKIIKQKLKMKISNHLNIDDSVEFDEYYNENDKT